MTLSREHVLFRATLSISIKIKSSCAFCVGAIIVRLASARRPYPQQRSIILDSMYTNKKAIQNATADWLKGLEWNRPFALTLTFKHGKSRPLSPDVCAQNVHHYLNLLCARLFKTSERKRGCDLKVFAVRETDAEGRIHYHLILDCPPKASHMSDEWFAHFLEHWWLQTRWGNKQICVKPCGMGWIDYMLKPRTKPNYDDCLDWQVSRI